MTSQLSVDGPLILSPNAVIRRVSDYPPEMRERLGGAADDHIVSERRSRYTALRVTRETAALMRRFTNPCTLVEAVVSLGRDAGEDPEALLDEVYPLVCQLRAHRLLIPERDARRVQIEPRFRRGDLVANCRVLSCVSAQTETEIYRVETSTGRIAALKWVPLDAPVFVAVALDREARFLDQLGACGVRSVPAMLNAGEDRGRFILVTWAEGRTVYEVSRDPSLDIDVRCQIADRLLATYAELHSHGVLHGDVHAGNVLVSSRHAPVVLDFGCARGFNESDPPPRAGLLTEYEPEAAARLLESDSVPPATERGEQYCIAALIFRLLTGAASLRLSLEGRVALRQIVSERPRTFADLGAARPHVESVLRVALAKDPMSRHSNVEEFLRLFRKAVAQPMDRQARKAGPTANGPLQRLLDGYGPGSSLLDRGLAIGPTASMYYGAAGIAFALLRASLLESCAEAFTAAEAWIERAVVWSADPSAFVGDEIGVAEADVGPAALLHTAPGVAAVHAMIRQASDDASGVADSVRAYLAALSPVKRAVADDHARRRFALDLMNGPAGQLLGVTLLYRMCIDLPPALREALTAAGDRLAREVAAGLRAFPDADVGIGRRYTGMAHGLAGALYAACCWVGACGGSLPASIADALDRQAGLAICDENWTAWPTELGSCGSTPWTGWCHGSAGHVLLWAAAARVRGETGDRDRAIGAARHIWQHRNHSDPTVCCGLAGEALALCEAARISGDPVWFDRARTLLNRALASPHEPIAPHSLFRGRAGVGLAEVEMRHPEKAGFPLGAPAL